MKTLGSSIINTVCALLYGFDPHGSIIDNDNSLVTAFQNIAMESSTGPRSDANMNIYIYRLLLFLTLKYYF